ncbi:MAG TPA: hypothetical protein VHA37_03320 [Candidatus Saccharimonadales bacterium]|nr:hypothetical protein [Candidatus Saccharimonadales bacterium]
MFDAGACAIQQLWEMDWLILHVGPVGNDWHDAAPARYLAVYLGIITLVANHRARCDVRTNIGQDFELRTVAGLIPGQMEIERQALLVALDMDLRPEPATRTPEGLACLPTFAPAAETCARIEVLSNIWISPAVRLHAASAWKNASKVPDCDRRQNRFQTVFQ